MKRLIKFLVLPVLCLIFSMGLIACDNNPTPLKRMDFEPNNGNAVMTIEYRLNTDIVPPNPTKSGFYFDGWFWDNNVWDKPFTLNSILDQPLQADMNLKVYAKWENKNSIFFDANGGSGTMNYQVITEGSSAELKENVFTRDNYDFLGWATSPSGNVAYTDGEVFNMAENGGLTLYAIWKTYTIQYFSIYGNLQTQSIKRNVAYGKTITILDKEEVWKRTGYTLIKWNTEADGSGADYAFGDTFVYESTESFITLYAIWEKDSGGQETDGVYPNVWTTQMIEGEEFTVGEILTIDFNLMGLLDASGKFATGLGGDENNNPDKNKIQVLLYIDDAPTNQNITSNNNIINLNTAGRYKIILQVQNMEGYYRTTTIKFKVI